MDRSSPRRIRVRARYKILTPILAGLVCAPAMILTTSEASAATMATAGPDAGTVASSNPTPVGNLVGYVEITVINALDDVGCGTIPSKAICP